MTSIESGADYPQHSNYPQHSKQNPFGFRSRGVDLGGKAGDV